VSVNQRTFRRWSRSVFAPLLLIIAAGCANFSNNRDLSVSVVDLLPTRASMFETGAALTLRFTNVSPEPVVLKGSAHRLHLNGSYVGRAVTNDPLTIPQFGTVTQSVTVYLENIPLVRTVLEFSKAPTAIQYRLESQLYAANPAHGARIRTSTSGEIDLRGFSTGKNAPPGRRPSAHQSPRCG